MADPPAETSVQAVRIAVTVRYFAAARAASGLESETVEVPVDTTVSGLVDILADRDTRLATVLGRCSYLRDGIAVRDEAATLSAGDTVDVLPPFAGG